MATFTENTFPQYVGQIRDLTRRHAEREREEPLLLAIIYMPKDESRDIHIFEVLDDFGANLVDDSKEFFEVAFDSSEKYQFGDRKLVLTLTNPIELKEAQRTHWNSFLKIKQALDKNKYEVLFKDEIQGKRLLDLFKA